MPKKYFIPLINKELGALKSDKKSTQEILDELAAETARKSILHKAIVTANILNIRSGAGASFTKVGSLDFGTEVSIISEKGRWSKIDDKNHWVSTRYIKKIHRAVVTVNELNVRVGPGIDFSKVRKIMEGDIVLVYEKTGKWCRISHSEEWVSGKYLESN